MLWIYAVAERESPLLPGSYTHVEGYILEDETSSPVESRENFLGVTGSV